MGSVRELGIVVIGRNEGERFLACLRSLDGVEPVIYVDSGSTDGSQAAARHAGATVVGLEVPPNFTAGRARNAGVAALVAVDPHAEFVQFIDGDCALAPGWLEAGMAALGKDASLAAVFGRCRERHPELSIYNRICDDEWNVPVGPAAHTGGNVMFRLAAFGQVSGFAEDLIAGEEPDLCLRLARRGWQFTRLDHEMVLHDAAMTRFRQWWRRTVRAGYAYAEHAARHGAAGFPEWRAQVRRSWIWGGLLPVLFVAGLIAGAAGIRAGFWLATLALILVPFQVARLAWRDRGRWPGPVIALQAAFFTTFGKLPQLAGILRQARDRRAGRRARIIEHKA